MKKLLALALLLLVGPAWAQNVTCPTRSVGDDSNACASTAFVQNALATIPPPGSFVIGTSAIVGGTNGFIVYDNVGIAGEYSITGTPGSVVMSIGPTFTGTIIASAANLSGTWTFNGTANFTSTFQVSGVAQTFPTSGHLVGTTDTQTLTNKSIDGSEINSGTIAGARVTPISLGSSANGGVTGTLGYANGGCNATSQVACTNNIFPGPNRAGDIAYWNGSTWTTLAGNNSGTKVLQETSSGVPSFATVTGTGTVTEVDTNAGTTGGPITSTGAVNLDGSYTGWALSNCTLSASVGSNLLTVALKDNSGADPSTTSPCNINYRSATASTGSLTLVQQTTAISISTNATGASLGSVANTAFRFWIVAFNNAGTNVLALFNASTASQIFPLNESAVASTTPISGSATSAGVFYTPNGTTVSSKAFRILGYIEYNSTGLATPGTYASGPNFIQNFGSGIRRPGEVVQTSFITTNTQTNVASTTFASTNLTTTLTPTSAANLFKGTYSGTMFVNGITSAGSTRLYRNTTGVGVIVTQATCGGCYSPQSNVAFDQPNTISAVTYVVKIADTDNSSTVSFPYTNFGASGALTVDEIQG